MRVLLIKMSSMGDIFHTFPAISDLKAHNPDVIIDWVVEDSFKEIVDWHPAINKVIPIHLRRWMKERNLSSWSEFKQLRKQLRTDDYDLVIDAQGLFKSAFIAGMAKSKSVQGFNAKSAREPIASLFYSQRHYVAKNQHAVERTRQLFGNIFGYTPAPLLNFGINQNFSQVAKDPRKLMFIIGTSWVTKLWSTLHWQRLAAIALEEGYDVEIMWGSPEEKAMADSIIAACPRATRPSQRMSITTIAEKLVGSAGVIGLDTGFSHLAGALETPTIALYGPTSPLKVGLIGEHTSNLQLEHKLACMPCHKRYCKWLPEGSHETPPCMNGIKPFDVWNTLNSKMAAHNQPDSVALPET